MTEPTPTQDAETLREWADRWPLTHESRAMLRRAADALDPPEAPPDEELDHLRAEFGAAQYGSSTAAGKLVAALSARLVEAERRLGEAVERVHRQKKIIETSDRFLARKRTELRVALDGTNKVRAERDEAVAARKESEAELAALRAECDAAAEQIDAQIDELRSRALPEGAELVNVGSVASSADWEVMWQDDHWVSSNDEDRIRKSVAVGLMVVARRKPVPEPPVPVTKKVRADALPVAERGERGSADHPLRETIGFNSHDGRTLGVLVLAGRGPGSSEWHAPDDLIDVVDEPGQPS